ncbi:THUMP domain-containing protein [Roseovarius salis]|uniref:THUMP domain-containing class I SAM-dependent RNA methyltransferase n=1 Tax=Roseovarius salis TaxID=3376063 RepID=UPI0037C63761
MPEREQGGLDIFLAAPPGLEPALAEEARAAGFAEVAPVAGGVTLRGGWPEVWRANLQLRGAARVLVRVGAFRALHLAQLDKRARKVPWGEILRRDVPVKVEASCHASRIYHDRAAAQRVAHAIAEELGAPVDARADLRVLVRIEDDLCTLSVDSSGTPLHRRGHKEAVGKAPLRETLAALFLRQCGFDGCEPVVDPMCGAGTLVIEAAEIAAGLAPGRSRGFAFEKLAGFDQAAWEEMRQAGGTRRPDACFHGSDRDDGAIRAATANAARAGVEDFTRFERMAVSARTAPAGPPGLVMVNPPYGGRIGNRKMLHALYNALGTTLQDGFSGWRVGLVTSEAGLARATGLPFAAPGPPVAHGGLKVRLWQTGPLA